MADMGDSNAVKHPKQATRLLLTCRWNTWGGNLRGSPMISGTSVGGYLFGHRSKESQSWLGTKRVASRAEGNNTNTGDRERGGAGGDGHWHRPPTIKPDRLGRDAGDPCSGARVVSLWRRPGIVDRVFRSPGPGARMSLSADSAFPLNLVGFAPDLCIVTSSFEAEARGRLALLFASPPSQVRTMAHAR